MAGRKKHHPPGKMFGSKKKKLYLAITAVMLLVLAIVAVSLLHSAAERRTAAYTQKARESIDSGDYENALLYLRRIRKDDSDTEILLLMADCYEAMGNYPRALETLRKLNTSDPAISNRIQGIEERKLQKEQKQKITVAGVAFDSTVQEANLDGMGLTDDELREITALYALDRLSLQNNQLTTVRELATLGGLDELNLAGNSIRDLDGLSSLTGLRVLNLDGNPITDGSVLYGLRFLTNLSVVDTGLEESELSKLSEALPVCAIRFGTEGAERVLLAGSIFDTRTAELSLHGRGLTDISMLEQFKDLKILDLSENEISDLRPLMELSELEKLNISGNEINDLRPLIGLPLLTKLEAADNEITETVSVGSMERLAELNLSGNPISDYSGLGKLLLLKTLNLRATGITDADLTELYPLKSVYNLDLQDNAGLSDQAVGALKSALPGCGVITSELVYEIDFDGHVVRSDEKSLILPSCGITNLSGLLRMTHLEELDLRKNEIMNLYPLEYTPSTATIRRLNLSDNLIMDVLSFYALSSIEELDLSGNRIETVAGLRKLTSLEKLDLSGNPVSEDAVNELRGWLPHCEIIF